MIITYSECNLESPKIRSSLQSESKIVPSEDFVRLQCSGNHRQKLALFLGIAPWEIAKRPKIKMTLLFMFRESNDLRCPGTLKITACKFNIRGLNQHFGKSELMMFFYEFCDK